MRLAGTRAVLLRLLYPLIYLHLHCLTARIPTCRLSFLLTRLPMLLSITYFTFSLFPLFGGVFLKSTRPQGIQCRGVAAHQAFCHSGRDLLPAAQMHPDIDIVGSDVYLSHQRSSLPCFVQTRGQRQGGPRLWMPFQGLRSKRQGSPFSVFPISSTSF